MGIDLDDAGTRGLTVLHRAVLSGHEDIIHILIEAGADVNAISNDFGTPLCLAALKGMVRITSLLLAHRARPSTVTPALGTALHCCVLSLGNYRDTVVRLLDAGASVSAGAILDTRWLQALCGWDGDDRNQIRSCQDLAGCILYDATPALVAARSFQSNLFDLLLPFDLDQNFRIKFLEAEDSGHPLLALPSSRHLQRAESMIPALHTRLHTYLSSCATNGDLSGVELLKTKGASFDTEDRKTIAPSMMAALGEIAPLLV